MVSYGRIYLRGYIRLVLVDELGLFSIICGRESVVGEFYGFGFCL